MSAAAITMLDAMFIGLMGGGFVALMLYVTGCEKL
jgi:hypothetical protein